MPNRRPFLRSTIAERLRALRAARRESALAVALAAGTTRTTLQGYENGTSPVPAEVLVLLARHYGVTLDWLCRPPGTALVWIANGLGQRVRVDETARVELEAPARERDEGGRHQKD